MLVLEPAGPSALLCGPRGTVQALLDNRYRVECGSPIMSVENWWYPIGDPGYPEAASGRSNKAIARKLGCDIGTVRTWRERFAELRLAGLDDAPRSGRPATFTAEQKCAVIAKALSEPPEGLSCWSLEDLVGAVVADETFPISSICPETIRTWLRDNELQPHRNKYWLNSKDPDFHEKMSRVLELYANPPKDGMLWCVDEKTGIQALFRKAPTKKVKKALIQRMEFEYRRKGTVGLLAAFEVTTA